MSKKSLHSYFHLVSCDQPYLSYSPLKANCIWTNSKFLPHIANIVWNNYYLESIYWLENEMYPWFTLLILLVKFGFMVYLHFFFMSGGICLWQCTLFVVISAILCLTVSIPYRCSNKSIPTVHWISTIFYFIGQPTQERSWNHEAYLLFPVHLDGTLLDNAKTMKAKKEFFATSDVLQIFRQVIRSLLLLRKLFFQIISRLF